MEQDSLVYTFPVADVPMLSARVTTGTLSSTACRSRRHFPSRLNALGMRGALSASIFARELGEFGVRWHRCDWSTHTILGAHPSHGAPPSMDMTTDDDQWEWIDPAPKSWLPTVVMGEPISVRFYSYTRLGIERIVRHFDSFERGSYRFKTEWTELARGAVGYVF